MGRRLARIQDRLPLQMVQLSAIMARLLSAWRAIAVRVFEDPARHEMGQGSGASPQEGLAIPASSSWRRRLPREQVELSRFAARIVMDARQPWHGRLPDSGCECPLLRPKAGHSIMRHRRVLSLAATRWTRPMQGGRPAGSQQHRSARTTHGETPRSGVPASD